MVSWAEVEDHAECNTMGGYGSLLLSFHFPPSITKPGTASLAREQLIHGQAGAGYFFQRPAPCSETK